ncbi:methyl-accepting chemotaxis protein [Sporomusa sphaeroides]|uniref:Methyl-accepting chemotaxis protein 4 n=1 Tax=Sporomusa sphaeroides DSM 2875 TaxID=1337886 RepID=A0ABM9W4Y3_9FIRM|nr:methyl-accepting chemotaxis protein [Sporomusa sphaeroides]OLS54769.1 methyl-accepting chemotaxis protein 4 [Sporomusa sphaeroides DSM 2875]CVK20082.1 Methyl-accepting chemotaxis protein 4 [Sporomusa sphaeroides DSM 2875]
MTKLKYRLIAALFATSFVCVLILSCYSVWSTIQRNEADIQEYRAMLYEQFDRSIKLEVETAHSLVQKLYAEQQQGVLSEAEAKKQAAALIRDLRFDNGNYFWIDTTEGINVVLLGRDIEGKSRLELVDAKGNKFIRDIINSGMQPAGGYTDYWFPKPNETEDLPKRGYSLLFKPYNWIIGTGNWVDDIEANVAAKAAANKRQLINDIGIAVLIAIIGLSISVCMALYISRKISDPIVAAAEGVRQIATGNLGVADLPVNARDETGMLSLSVNEMKASLRELIREVADSSNQVAAASQELTATSEQTALASSQVAASTTEMARGSENQVQVISHASGAIEHMSVNIEQITDKVKAVAEVSGKTATAARDGEQAVYSAIKQMTNIEKTVTDSAAVVSKLGERSQEIGQIIDTIAGIAGQTNLLALNAAIEAARAGEQGRGFAVVAEEVRKLAEQSHGATQQIAGLIQEIQADTERAVKAMGTGTGEVKLGTSLVSSAETAFHEISAMVNQVSLQVNEVTVAVQQVAQGSQAVVSSIRQVETIARDAAAETGTISAATEEQTASMEEIASASQSLAQLAEKIQAAVAKFRV